MKMKGINMKERVRQIGRIILAASLMFFQWPSGPAFAAGPVMPNLPETFDTPYSLPTGGTTWTVNSGGNLQNAIDNAALGDVIVLEAGATFTGTIYLPIKSGTGWLYIISSELASLPEGQRVTAADAVHMPKIVTPFDDGDGRPAMFTQFSAHHYRFCGIEFAATSRVYNLVWQGSGFATYKSWWSGKVTATTLDELPSNITYDRCYFHSTSESLWARVGLDADGRYIAVVDSRFENFKDTSDSQAFLAWNGPGPYKIVNNYLESAGENILFGGADPAINHTSDPGDFPNVGTGVIPSDIEVRGNYFYKPDKWNYNSPFFNGEPVGGWGWVCKNLFEIKNAQRVLVTGNILENSYGRSGGQRATAIVLTPRNQSGTAPWSVMRDVTIKNNIVRSEGIGFRMTAEDGNYPSDQTQRILIENNLFDDIRSDYGTTENYGFWLETKTGGRPVLDVMIRNNLMAAGPLANGSQRAAIGFWSYEKIGDPLIMQNNIFTYGDYAINSVSTFSADSYCLKNVFILRTCDSRYSWNKTWYFDSHFTGSHINTGDNFYADGADAVGFTDYANLNYRLTAQSTYHNAGTDGKDPGPNYDTLEAATAHTGDGSRSSSTNQPPHVNAGNDQTVVFPAPSQMAAQVTDDGIPGGQLIYSWRLISGSGSATFSNTSLLNPTVQFSAVGVYVLRLTAYDGDKLSFDEVQVTMANETLPGSTEKDRNVISPGVGSEAQINFNCEGPAHVVIKIYSRQGLVKELVSQDYADRKSVV